MRVLLLADHCNPEMASTPYFGYRLCEAIADRVDEVVLATQVRNREAFERHGGCGRAEVVFLDSEYVARPAHRLADVLRRDANTAMTLGAAMKYPAYLAFEREAWKRFKPQLTQGRFDVVHRVTPLSPTLPSPIVRWCPVPFVIGPVNGGLAWPSQYTAELRREKEWFRYLRGAHRAMPFYRSTYRLAAAILAGFAHTIADLPISDHQRVLDCPDVGVDAADFPERRRDGAGSVMTVCSVGRLVPYKCPDVVIEAFARSTTLRRHRLLVIGDGPERPRLEGLVRDHGLTDCVEFLGWLPHAEVVARMRAADVLAFPSIRELGAGVVLEGMAAGLACVVVDYGAPGVYVDADRGIKVPLVERTALIDRYAKAMDELAGDAEHRAALGEAARRYVLERHTWPIKAEKIVETYRWVLGERSEKPNFHQPPTCRFD